MLQITGLFIYPVKSCRGISLAEVELGPRGFLHDREFLVVDEAYSAITQRTASELATVECAITGSELILENGSAGELRVPLLNEQERSAAGTPRTVKIFSDQVLAIDAGNDAAEWFSDVLRRSSRLMRIGPSYSRKVAADEIAPAHRGPQEPEISFTDAFPTLLTSEESLADLNSRLGKPVPMDRFRPNIVVRGAAPYAEDNWQTVQTEEIVFGCAAPNLRCVITTIDQETGRRDGSEPLRTLATYRRAPNGSGVMFGQYLVHARVGRLRVGGGLVVEPSGG